MSDTRGHVWLSGRCHYCGLSDVSPAAKVTCVGERHALVSDDWTPDPSFSTPDVYFGMDLAEKADISVPATDTTPSFESAPAVDTSFSDGGFSGGDSGGGGSGSDF